MSVLSPALSLALSEKGSLIFCLKSLALGQSVIIAEASKPAAAGRSTFRIRSAQETIGPHTSAPQATICITSFFFALECDSFLVAYLVAAFLFYPSVILSEGILESRGRRLRVVPALESNLVAYLGTIPSLLAVT